MLNVEVRGDRELIARLEGMPAQVKTALVRKVTVLDLKLRQRVEDKLHGPVLNVRSGDLSRSIKNREDISDTSVYGNVFSDGSVKYAGIHEFGGTTNPHVILPVKANVLAFMIGGKQVFAKRVNHPGSKMPERSFLRSSLADMKDEIIAGLTQAVREGVAK